MEDTLPKRLIQHVNLYDPYHELLEEILENGVEETNARTGSRILAAQGPRSFSLELGERRLPVTGTRRLFPKTAAAEVAWFLMGTRDASWIRAQAPIWDKFLEEDGTLPASIMPDFLHPEREGYVRWAEALEPHLERLVK